MPRILGRLAGLSAVFGCMGLPFAAQPAGGDEGPNPTISMNGTRGLVYVQSAETMGAGRLSFSLGGNWYKQQADTILLAPNPGANVFSGTLAFSFGVSPWFDVFLLGSGFGIENYDSSLGAGIGSIQAGVVGALPLPEESPIHLGAQVSVIGGTSANQIDANGIDGYDYFETRTGYDFTGRLLESVVLGKEALSFKIHLNEGAVFSLQSGKDPQMLLGFGLQGNVHSILVLGLEVNSRTFFKAIELATDPLWVTPSITFRTPYYMNFVIGGDISLSQKRTSPDPLRSLEQYRVFGAIDFTFDLLAGKRKAERDAKAQAEREASETQKKTALEKEEQAKKEAGLRAANDSLARKMKADSITAAKQRDTEKRRADSLAQKAVQDSIALAETKKHLQDEMSKRSDVEKQLLSTGLLILDAVYFESGRTEISINSKPYLNIIGKMLLKYPKLQIEIGGYTDNIGGYEANKRLSYARAESVRQYLVQVAPELATHLTANGYGPDNPKADNRSAAGRKQNRRVEMQVMNKDALREYNP